MHQVGGGPARQLVARPLGEGFLCSERASSSTAWVNLGRPRGGRVSFDPYNGVDGVVQPYGVCIVTAGRRCTVNHCNEHEVIVGLGSGSKRGKVREAGK
jgi:hypothetical protein